MIAPPIEDSFLINVVLRISALNKDDVWDTYKALNENGKRVDIDYADFEWRYYQFYHGSRDLSIRRSPENSSPVTFSDLPMDVLEKIVKKLEIENRLAIRKVSRDLRYLVDTTEAYTKEFTFSFWKDCATISSVGRSVYYYGMPGGICEVDLGLKNKRYRDDRDFKQVMIADATTILRNPKLRIEHHMIEVEDGQNGQKFYELLNSLGFQLNVRSIGLSVEAMEYSSILQCLKPGILEDVYIHHMNMPEKELTKILEMEQWKMAKSVRWWEFGWDTVFPLRSMMHLKEIDVSVVKLTNDDMILIRDVLLKSPFFESAEFRECYFDFLSDGSGHTFDGIMSQNPLFDIETRRFSIPDSRDYFQVEFDGDYSGWGTLVIEKISV